VDLKFSETQEMLKKMASDFTSAECPKAKVRELEEDETGYSPDIWKKMAGLGWMGLIIPEEYSGMEMAFQDLIILMEELGRNILPGPFFSTVVGTFPILEGGTEEQKKELLQKIASGESIISLALLEADDTFFASSIATTATPTENGFVINGTKLFVEMAHIADKLICAVKTKDTTNPEEGITLFIVDAKSPGVHFEVMPTIAMDKLCEVKLENVLVPKEGMLGELNKGWPLIISTLEKGALIKSAESVGAMQACVDMTVEYSKERVQYDRPIGSYQALQHIMVDMWIAMETSRYLLYKSAWAASEGLPCSKEASATKAYVNEAYKHVSKWAIRLHGGIGTSREHDISLYYRRARSSDPSFGGTDFHREIVAEKIGLI